MISEIITKLESAKTLMKNQSEGTIDVVPFELVKQLLEPIDTHILELEGKLAEWRKLYYKN